jgi:hypothetical protein
LEARLSHNPVRETVRQSVAGQQSSQTAAPPVLVGRGLHRHPRSGEFVPPFRVQRLASYLRDSLACQEHSSGSSVGYRYARRAATHSFRQSDPQRRRPVAGVREVPPR